MYAQILTKSFPFPYAIYVRESLEWTRQIDIQVSDLGIDGADAIADINFYLLVSKHPALGFVSNWFGYHVGSPNNPRYTDVISRDDIWFDSEETAIAHTKADLTAFLREFTKQEIQND